MFYGTAGGKDLMQRKWKGLADFVTMECDGKDLTPVLREHKVHAIVFLNIPRWVIPSKIPVSKIPISTQI